MAHGGNRRRERDGRIAIGVRVWKKGIGWKVAIWTERSTVHGRIVNRDC